MTRIVSRAKNFQFNEIQLADHAQGYEWVQLLKTGTFMHPAAPGGKFSITSETLKNMTANFHENIRRLKGRDLAVDYSHESGGKASGWIREVQLREDETELWIEVDWTPNARQSIEEKEFRYISADIDFNYVDNESGNTHGPTLLGAGLTNRPHIKDMEIILNEQGVDSMNLEQIMAAISSLAPEDKELMMKKLGVSKEMEEEKAKLEETEEQLSEKSTELAEVKTKLESVETENSELKAEKETMQKEAKFSELMTDGKVTPAQKESFMKMELTLAEEFFKNAEGLHLEEDGHGKEKETEKEDAVSVSVKLDEEAEKLMKEDGKLTLTEAYSKVLDANDELRKQYEGTEE